MTEIYHQNGVSIQVFNTARAALLAGVARNEDFTLDKPGRFLGCSGNADCLAASGSQVIVTFRNTDDSLLTYGQSITAIRCRLVAVTDATPAAHAVVFIGY